MIIQSGLELRNALLMVLSKYSLCSWYLFLSPSDLWLWNCSSVKRMIFFFSSCLSICPWDLREKSHLCHSRCRADVLMRGAIRGLQSDSNVWIIFKLNDNEGFFPSVFWIYLQLFPDSARRSAALGIEPQTGCFLPLFIGSEETGWSRCAEQLRSFDAGPTRTWQGVSLWHLRALLRRSPRVFPPNLRRLLLRCSGITLSCLAAARRGEMMAAER